MREVLTGYRSGNAEAALPGEPHVEYGWDVMMDGHGGTHGSGDKPFRVPVTERHLLGGHRR
jgi:hypothetical protein